MENKTLVVNTAYSKGPTHKTAKTSLILVNGSPEDGEELYDIVKGLGAASVVLFDHSEVEFVRLYDTSWNKVKADQKSAIGYIVDRLRQLEVPESEYQEIEI